MTPNQLLFEVLIHAYTYYYADSNFINDVEYDALAKKLYKNKDKLTDINGLKYLIDWEMFKTSTSLYYVRDYRYPQGFLRIWKRRYDALVAFQSMNETD